MKRGFVFTDIKLKIRLHKVSEAKVCVNRCLQAVWKVRYGKKKKKTYYDLRPLNSFVDTSLLKRNAQCPRFLYIMVSAVVSI